MVAQEAVEPQPITAKGLHDLQVMQLIPLFSEVDLAQLRARTPEPQGLVQVQDGNARKVGDAGHGLQDPEFLDWAVDVYHIQDQAQRIKGQLDKQRGVELPVALVALLLHAGHRIIVQGKARQLFLDHIKLSQLRLAERRGRIQFRQHAHPLQRLVQVAQTAANALCDVKVQLAQRCLGWALLQDLVKVGPEAEGAPHLRQLVCEVLSGQLYDAGRDLSIVFLVQAPCASTEAVVRSHRLGDLAFLIHKKPAAISIPPHNRRPGVSLPLVVVEVNWRSHSADNQRHP
mmetsp:Transcript_23041/g.63636  ORF Transcript_23041/g.63636 Transcript_23041/m.63636 type:complete len:287 (-) Transcript_23041:3176-4036(-)